MGVLFLYLANAVKWNRTEKSVTGRMANAVKWNRMKKSVTMRMAIAVKWGRTYAGKRVCANPGRIYAILRGRNELFLEEDKP